MPILDSEQSLVVTGALLTLVILAFLIERALAIVFNHRWYKSFENKGFKSIIAFLISAFICWYYDFDVIAHVLEPGSVTTAGLLLTAGIIAGGSEVAVELVQNIWGFGKKAGVARGDLTKLRLNAEKLELEARVGKAAAEIAQVKGDGI